VSTRSSWFGAIRPWWPPVHRREFWVTQALVIGIAVGHALNEWLEVVALHGAEFLPVSLYLLPVVYAALSFGIRGAAPTAAWSVLLTIPNIVIWHEGFGALGELWQASLVLALGLFIGARVDRERTARLQVEARERERRASEDRYRGLFEAAADAILLLDGAGVIQEANSAAIELLAQPQDKLQDTRVSDVDPHLGRALDSAANDPSEPVQIDRATGTVWVQPVTVPFRDAEGRRRVLVQLHDVTLARERQHLLESFARDTVAAREEERRRVARDLHDGPLQSLMLLWRSLDVPGSSVETDPSGVLAEARARAEEAADELRRFSRDLRPSLLDDLGLASALKAEAMALADQSGLDVTFRATGATGRRLPMEIELTLLRICQEALRNVERHAQATHVHVQLDVQPEEYRLLVEDDGIGMGSLAPTSKRIGAGRLGLVGMQERARLVGANCTVRDSYPGTTVEVRGQVLLARVAPDAPRPAS
jgi:PAS domain S-box-containing protein